MEIGNKIINATQPDTIVEWQAINWQQTKYQVRKIQERIVKAVQSNQWRVVRSLQRLLVRSLAAKQLAVKQIMENRGKSTAGVDGELWLTPKVKTEQIYKLKWR